MVKSAHFLLSLFAILLLKGCDVGAGGKPIVFQVAVDPEHNGGVFTTALGWEVTLQEACVGVGTVYVWAGASHLSAMSAAMRWWGVSRAWAHAGDNHFDGGSVRGEWLDPFVLMPLRPETADVGAAQGLEGPVGSFSLVLGVVPPSVPGASCLRGHSAYVAGTARKEGHSVSFEGGLDIPSIGTNRRIDGLSLSAVLTAGAQLRLRAHPKVWLDQVQFYTSTSSSTDQLTISPETQAHRAWFVGLRSAGSFTAEVQGHRP